jgi:nitronate monooxygenase
MTNAFLERVGIQHPIIQAPMGGANATPPSLVAAVSNAGGLGFLGAAYMTPEQITKECAAIRALTSRPFGLNLFAPTDVPALPNDLAIAMGVIARYHGELGLDAPKPPTLPTYTFDQQLDAALDGGMRVFSFTFNTLPAETIARVKQRGVYVVGTATTVEEATILARLGVDAIAAQGSEAGAHRGTFVGSFETSMVETMALVPQVVRAVELPVIAAGGIMNGQAVAATLKLGASAAALGTAFLVTDECGVAESYKALVLSSRDDGTRVTRAFSGRPARGIVNRAMNEIEASGSILPYPYQNSLTRDMRTAAAKQGRPEYLSLWAGQGAPLARRMPAATLVDTLVREMAEPPASIDIR